MMTDITDDMTWFHECYEVDGNRHVHTSSFLVEAGSKHVFVDTSDLPNQEPMLSQIKEETDDSLDALYISKSHMPHSANVTSFAERWSDLKLIFPGGISNVHSFPPVTQ